MDPLSAAPAVPVDLAALLARAEQPREAQIKAALLALVGQELSVLFEATVPEGVRLRLPQGQLLVAQGKLPYPEGTVLRVQVLPPPAGETAPRLQPLSAHLPPAPAVLATLLQGEAYPLLQRLQAPEPPPPLRALATLFQYLDALAPSPIPSPLAAPAASPGRPQPLPEVPPPLRAALAKILPQLLPPESPEALVGRWLKEAAQPVPNNVPLPTITGAVARLGQDPTLPPAVREAFAVLWEARGGPVALPPDLRRPIAEVLAPRLPPRPLEALLQEWVARPASAEGSAPPSAAPVAGQPPEADLPALKPLAAWLETLPPQLREALLPLLREGSALPPVPAASVGSASLLAVLATLPPQQREAIAQRLGLPPGRPPTEIALAFLDPTKSATVRLEDLPPALAKVLSEALPAPGKAPLPELLVTSLERRISSWPEPLFLEMAEAVARALPSPLPAAPTSSVPRTPRDLAEALVRWLQNLEPAGVVRGTALASALSPTPSRAFLEKTLPLDLPPEALRLLNHPALPAGLKETARTWLKALYAPSPAPETPASPPLAKNAPPPALDALPLHPQARAALESRLALAAPDTLAHAEPWAGWVEASLRTLANPQASPREAPFHALQALDGTAYFEIPLPGRASGPLQIWVEQEGAPAAPDAPPIHKVLFGLRFTSLGETRVGLLQTAGSLSVRIWAERPDALRGGEEALKAKLEALGGQVSLRIASLPQGSPTPRTLAVGPGYQGLA